MSKIKMRCVTCGKWFQSANAKEVTCPDCTQKARKEKQAAKNTPPVATRPAPVASPVQPKPAAAPRPKATQQGGTNSWLDQLNDVKIAEPEPPPRPKVSTPPRAREQRRDSQNDGMRGPQVAPPAARGPSRGPGAYQITGDARLSPNLGQRPQQPRPPMQGTPGQGPRPAKPWQKEGARGGFKGKPRPKGPRPAPAPKPKREKILPPPPFVPTPEQIHQVEERYQILAQPTEFDGIRTQIAQEVGIPKKAVKKIIKDLRDREQIPSWWELQTYKGSSEELDRIKATYLPYLPIPPVGVHKLLADALELKPGTVYQAIKTIRTEMNLPQYNDPTVHGEEMVKKFKPAEHSDSHSQPAQESLPFSESQLSPASPTESQGTLVPSTLEERTRTAD
ncbi:hypothetical protein [Tengunoibacter tsumagoiensis]|uniref:Uncharacterized protein n=1 Tax=Tengunoibacter tsumagoiensis TaxID=2014871 RepID=A0A401ZXA7_9CHLR|nr:hypothetical protein [Tengunoibacter tsumagoiensis]GCE11479.1 hypothetical protein KTT_13380 [Tengunoibacter tsumagoiensis]